MKKLMIAAVATAMVGAAFAACDRPDITTNDCAEVYDVVMNLKTTKCLCQLRKFQEITASECLRNSTTNWSECVSWRSIVTKKVYGVIWACHCTCTEDLGEASPLLLAPEGWTYDTDANAGGNQYFWMPSEKIELDSFMTFATLQRIGAANGKVEAWGTFGDGVNFAGFGTHGALRTKTLSGAVAGCWGAPYDCKVYPTEIVKCPAYQLCPNDDGVLEPVEDDSCTAVYGTFTVKYNNAKSIKLANGGDLLKSGVIPAQWNKLIKRADIPEYESASAG